MNEYMLIYKGGDPNWMENVSKQDMDASMQRWGAWMGRLQEQDQLVSGGSPLAYSGKTLTKEGVVTDIAASEFKELVSGYSIVKAQDIDAATDIARDCPIFTYPNITVEVRQVIKMD